MAEREQVRRERVERDPESAEETVAQAVTERGERLKEELDDLLDEIDGVLESNAEEFVKSYVQKGGE
ncbi:MAG TPA: ubiquitin-like protein Pup [Acidimicrobiaceae bacterium]|jgi:ubiquitin-like protein Pup|uniref:Prokaryotic ubiquitin-like protein Pup n=1 Tax=marine metagenome TaxID=408172 RepID=A0A381PEF4_9ZZZZ|nr:ubiquitin-like protein Pup [Acidimicrobiaceae bacterium]MCH2413726.1 ubiquitin-like protein Pup [Acidimicrobiales bacterium]MEC9203052.1 ubiquitin-like protein Pup [Actinomycetota bacterium]MDE0749294.1 ubiquitin-like protein Pup [Acidimicrobiales bacterium]MED5583848.1 ubiquitin-like protein Pup [Actinomycetota bacterium]|tara:strand:- start:13590 stop:13790 length:201 start_codon:yes stop_codon:yes gene_type:complete